MEPARAERGLIVIGAGLPRTGTLSLKEALNTLLDKGCYHMSEVFKNGDHAAWAALFTEGWKAHKDEILEILQPYASCTDLPPCLVYKELMRTFPDAKVLLSVRDNFDAWYSSVMQTVYQVYHLHTHIPGYVKWVDEATNSTNKHMADITSALFGPQGLFKGQFLDKEAAKQIYEDWIADVKRTVPADRLLVFNVKEGWEPLCKFLDVPVPQDKPFPQINDTAHFQALAIKPRKRRLALLTWLPPAALTAVTGAAVAAVRLAAQKGGSR